MDVICPSAVSFKTNSRTKSISATPDAREEAGLGKGDDSVEELDKNEVYLDNPESRSRSTSVFANRNENEIGGGDFDKSPRKDRMSTIETGENPIPRELNTVSSTSTLIRVRSASQHNEDGLIGEHSQDDVRPRDTSEDSDSRTGANCNTMHSLLPGEAVKASSSHQSSISASSPSLKICKASTPPLCSVEIPSPSFCGEEINDGSATRSRDELRPRKYSDKLNAGLGSQDFNIYKGIRKRSSVQMKLSLQGEHTLL